MAEVNAVVLTSSVVDLLDLVAVTCRVIFLAASHATTESELLHNLYMKNTFF
jgi:hypothetical protein